MPFRYDDHAAFVFSSWVTTAGPRDALAELVDLGGLRIVVAEPPGRDDRGRQILAGWAAVVGSDPQRVIWAYVRPRARGEGYMTELLLAAHCDPRAPMVAVFPSPACEGLIRKKWPISMMSSGDRERLYWREESAS